MVRIQVLLTPEEREAFRRMARREGVSLSAWLRRVGLDRLAEAEGARRFRRPEELEEFFADCDRRETGHEPDWSAHLDVMRRSRATGESGT